MNCEELEPWISAYQDHELDPRRRRIVEAHLTVCRDCRALADGWVSLAHDLRVTLSRLEPPEELHRRVIRQIPVSAAPVRTRSSFRWPQGRPSFALVPLSAAAACLLWGAHPAVKAPVPPSTPGPPSANVEAFAAPPRDGTIPAMLPGNTLAPQYATLPGTKPGTGERPRASDPLKESPAPGHGARAEKTQGHRTVQEDALRRLRRLRPRRARYVLVQNRPVVGRRRHHSWSMVASRPELPAEAAPRSTAGSPQIRVVEYVLPAIQAPIPAADTGTDPGQRPTQPAPAVQAGFDL